MVIGVIRLATNPQSISQSEVFFTGNVMFHYLQHLSLVKHSFRRFADEGYQIDPEHRSHLISNEFG